MYRVCGRLGDGPFGRQTFGGHDVDVFVWVGAVKLQDWTLMGLTY